MTDFPLECPFSDATKGTENAIPIYALWQRVEYFLSFFSGTIEITRWFVRVRKVRFRQEIEYIRSTYYAVCTVTLIFSR